MVTVFLYVVNESSAIFFPLIPEYCASSTFSSEVVLFTEMLISPFTFWKEVSFVVPSDDVLTFTLVETLTPGFDVGSGFSVGTGVVTTGACVGLGVVTTGLSVGTGVVVTITGVGSGVVTIMGVGSGVVTITGVGSGVVVTSGVTVAVTSGVAVTTGVGSGVVVTIGVGSGVTSGVVVTSGVGSGVVVGSGVSVISGLISADPVGVFPVNSCTQYFLPLYS